MQVTKSTVFPLFQIEKRHLVPLFQRAYVWNKDAQWMPLWDNIRDKADEVVAFEAGMSGKMPSLHFLGAIVRSPFATTGNQVAAHLLIDGQQRLTTLQIILFALRDYLKVFPTYAAPNHKNILKRLTENEFAVDPLQSKEQYKIWPTNADRHTFEEIAQAGTPEALKAAFPPYKAKHKKKYEPAPLLVDAYLFFYKSIAEYVSGAEFSDSANDVDETPSLRLSALVKTLQHHMELVVIDLDGDEDPQIIFETLNARGAKLLPSDLVRNFVFWDATRKGEKTDALHGKYWEAYDVPENGFWKQHQQQGRLNRPRIDLFLFHYLVYQTRGEVSITDLFNTFREWWQKEPRNVEHELAKIQQFSILYRELIEPSGQDRFSLFARRVRVLDAGTIYPLLLFLKGDTHSSLTPDELSIIAAYLESYLVRRMVCGLTTKRYNLTFLDLLKHLTSGKNVLSPQTFVKYLSDLGGDSTRWPDDAEFKTAWMTRPVYTSLSKGRTVMVLLALDLQLTTNKQIQVHVTGPVTIEHIMPQNGSATDWPLAVDTIGMADAEVAAATEKAQMERANLIHTFGNLTLLTQSLNSSVSNGPFVHKRPTIAKHANLQLNTYLQTESGQTWDAWDEDDIRKRGEDLFETALKIWPKP